MSKSETPAVPTPLGKLPDRQAKISVYRKKRSYGKKKSCRKSKNTRKQKKQNLQRAAAYKLPER
jgi:hypothetical protein